MNRSGEKFDFIIHNLLNSVFSLNKKVYKVFNNNIQKDFEISHQVLFEDYNNLEMGYGLKAGEKILNNSEIFKISLSLGLNGSDLIDLKDNDKNKTVLKELCRKTAKTFHPNNKYREEKVFQNQMLMWQILLSSVNEDAYNHDMVDAFPFADLTQPVYTNQEIFDKILSKNLKRYYYENRLYFDRVFELIKQEAIFDITYEAFLWAINNAYARKILLLDRDTNTPYEVILPVIDFINHSSTHHNLHCEPHFEVANNKSFLIVKTSREIEAGEQLFFDYGPCSNKKFMHLYGFFDTENPVQESEFLITGDSLLYYLEIDTSNQIISEYISYLNSNQDFKNSVLLKDNLSIEHFQDYNITLFNNKFDNNFLKYLRVVFLDNKDILNNKEKIFRHNFIQKYSDSNEKKVYEYIKFILNQYYKDLKNINHKDLILSLGKIDSLTKYKTKNMYLLENEEKILIEKNLNYVESKLNKLI